MRAFTPTPPIPVNIYDFLFILMGRARNEKG
jgi:hypothetical protein